MLNGWQKQDLLKRRFTLPNELFSLKLSSAEISIYLHLLELSRKKTLLSYGTLIQAFNLTIYIDYRYQLPRNKQ